MRAYRILEEMEGKLEGALVRAFEHVARKSGDKRRRGPMTATAPA
jgi:hypothetical protein